MFLCIYGLLNGAVSVSDCTEKHGNVMSELFVRKNVDISCSSSV
jgi:hypothetical protein